MELFLYMNAAVCKVFLFKSRVVLFLLGTICLSQWYKCAGVIILAKLNTIYYIEFKTGRSRRFWWECCWQYLNHDFIILSFSYF